MTKLDNEVCELTTSELNEVSGGGGILIDFGYATVTMAWGAGGCKMAGVTTNDGHTTWFDTKRYVDLFAARPARNAPNGIFRACLA